MITFVERLLWTLGASTVLVILCQLLVFLLYPLLVSRSTKPSKKFQPLQRPSDSPLSAEAISIREFPSFITSTNTLRSTIASSCAALFPSNRAEWAALIEAFFLGLAASTLIADALFHLIPEALISALETSTTPINHSSHAGMLGLGFWALGGMLLVVVVEGIVHSEVSMSSLCFCCTCTDEPVPGERPSMEKLELCDIQPLSTGASGFPTSRHGDDDHSNSSTDDSIHDKHHHHHHHHHNHNHDRQGGCGGGLCNHGFAHLIMEEESCSNSSGQEENDQDCSSTVRAPSHHEKLQCTKTRRLSTASSTRRTVSIPSTREETDEFPESTDRDENDDHDTDETDEGIPLSGRHYRRRSESALMKLRPQTAPGSFMILDNESTEQFHLTKPRPAPGHSHTGQQHRRYSYSYHNHSAQNIARQKMLRSTAWANLIAELLHNFVDGLAIGIAFLSGSPAIGVATSIAIFAHEVPSQIADFIILLRGGFPPVLAYCLNFGVAFGIHLGSLAALFGTPESYHTALQMLAAGNFLCLGLSMIIPQLRDLLRSDHHQHHQHPDSTATTNKSQPRRLLLGASIGLAGGVALMASLALLGT